MWNYSQSTCVECFSGHRPRESHEVTWCSLWLASTYALKGTGSKPQTNMPLGKSCLGKRLLCNIKCNLCFKCSFLNCCHPPSLALFSCNFAHDLVWNISYPAPSSCFIISFSSRLWVTNSASYPFCDKDANTSYDHEYFTAVESNAGFF